MKINKKAEKSACSTRNKSQITTSQFFDDNTYSVYFPLNRKTPLYSHYSIPNEIRPSPFPYFLNSPNKESSAALGLSNTKTPQKSQTKEKFLLQLPNKAFRKRKVIYNTIQKNTSSVIEKINQNIQERRFSAVKKTVPLEKMDQCERLQETLHRVLKAEDYKNSSRSHENGLSPQSLSRSIRSIGRPRGVTSPLKNKFKKDLFNMSPSQISLKSSLNLEIAKKKVEKDKDQAFLDLYFNSFDLSPENKNKNLSKSRMHTPLLSGFSFKKEPVSSTIRLNKIECDEKDSAQQQNPDFTTSAKLEGKKRGDHNFMKILLHYWKFEKKPPRNRPAPQKKNLIWNRKINYASIRKNLIELFHFLSKLNISLAEVLLKRTFNLLF